MSAHWTARALADLETVDQAYASTRTDYADRVGDVAFAAARFPSEFPRAGPSVEAGIRQWSVPGADCVLLYRVIDADVEVLRVRHGREDWRP